MRIERGRDIDLRKFATEGMELYGKLVDCDGSQVRFATNLAAVLDSADKTYNGINERIDQFIAAQGIDAPPASRYQPVWKPSQERETLALAEANRVVLTAHMASATMEARVEMGETVIVNIRAFKKRDKALW